MVSVLLIIMETVLPIDESGPKVLKMSSVIPVAAEEENILIMATAKSSPGILNRLVIGEKR